VSAREPIVVLRVRGLDCWAVSGLGCGSLLAPALARIADLAPDARSDHSGKLLRFADRGQAEYVRARLSELGYQSELAGDREVQVKVGWFTPDDLSRKEAKVLSTRLVSEFVRGHATAVGVTDELMQRVEDALFAGFTAEPAAREVSRAGRADRITAATVDLVGSENARALGRYVDDWLERK